MEVVRRELEMPTGYSLSWSGQYEYMLRAKEKLTYVVPLTLAIIVILLYVNFRNVVEVAIIMGTLPLVSRRERGTGGTSQEWQSQLTESVDGIAARLLRPRSFPSRLAIVTTLYFRFVQPISIFFSPSSIRWAKRSCIAFSFSRRSALRHRMNVS